MDDADQTVFIKDIAEAAPIKVKLDDIQSITVDVHKTNILRIITESRTIMHRESLKTFKKRFLDTGLFVKLDHSKVVGKRHVRKVDDDGVILTNGFAYPVRQRQPEVRADTRRV